MSSYQEWRDGDGNELGSGRKYRIEVSIFYEDAPDKDFNLYTSRRGAAIKKAREIDANHDGEHAFISIYDQSKEGKPGICWVDWK